MGHREPWRAQLATWSSVVLNDKSAAVFSSPNVPNILKRTVHIA
jgi:hypothetical protein